MGLRTSSNSQLDPISPELALVDPELAKRARSDLEGPGSSRPLAPTGTARDARSETRSRVRAGTTADAAADRSTNEPFERSLEADVPAPDRSRSRPIGRRRRFVFAALAVFIGGAAGVMVADRGIGRGADQNASQPEARGEVDAGESPTTQPSGRSARRTATNRSSAVRPGSTDHSSKSRRAESPPAAPQPQVFVWPAAEGALYYKVQFFRAGKEVFEALPSAPRLGLPVRWVYKGRRLRLVPGTYSWRVLPAFGSRSHPHYGDPIVRSTWVAKS